MLKLKQIISQLSENDFEELSESFRKTKADNNHTLLTSYKENIMSDNSIITTLEITSTVELSFKSVALTVPILQIITKQAIKIDL